MVLVTADIWPGLLRLFSVANVWVQAETEFLRRAIQRGAKVEDRCAVILFEIAEGK